MSLLSTAARALPRSGIRVVMDEAWALEAELRSRTAGAKNSRTFDRVIHLEVGQPDFESPAAAVSAASHTLAKGGSATKYCPNAGTSELRHAVADYYQNTLNTVCRVTCQTTEQNIVVSTGSMFALSTAFMCALEPGSGEECLIPDPGFPNYAMAIQMLGCRPVRYPMLSSDGWLPTADAIANRITAGRTKLLLLNSPSNPTGRVMPLELMQSIVDVARENDVAVLSDEIYGDIYFGASCSNSKSNVWPAVGPAPSILHCDHDPESTMVVSGVSKRFAMTGFRVGWLRAHESVARVATKLQEPFVSCGAPFSQAAAAEALRSTDATAEAEIMRQRYMARRDAAMSVLRESGMESRACCPEGAFYMLVDVGISEGAEGACSKFCSELLQEEGVAVAPGSTFGSNSQSHVRVALAAADQDVVEGVRRLCHFVERRGVASS